MHCSWLKGTCQNEQQNWAGIIFSTIEVCLAEGTRQSECYLIAIYLKLLSYSITKSTLGITYRGKISIILSFKSAKDL